MNGHKDPHKPTTAQQVASTLAGNGFAVAVTHPGAQAIACVQAGFKIVPQAPGPKIKVGYASIVLDMYRSGDLWKGIGANLTGKSFQRVVKFVGVDKVTAAINEGDMKYVTPATRAAAGFITGVGEGLGTIPTEFFRKTQATSKLGFTAACRVIANKHGAKFITHGAFSNVITKSLFTGTFFGTNEFIKQQLPKTDSKAVQGVYTFSASIFASLAGILVCNPTDVTHTRIVKGLKDGTQYNPFGTCRAMYGIFQKDGLRAFGKGIGGKVIILPISMALISLTNDVLNDQWRHINETAAKQPKMSR
jgi:hypothetical protein